MCLDILNHLAVAHDCARQTDRQTEAEGISDNAV